MLEYIPLAISSLTAAKNIASSLLELRDFDKIASATMELKGHLIQTYDHIISEKERVLSLQERISELEKECARLKEWGTEKEKYSRRQIALGVFTYVDKNYEGRLNECHKYCANCFEKGIPSTLQRNQRMHGYFLECPKGCPPLAFREYIDKS